MVLFLIFNTVTLLPIHNFLLDNTAIAITANQLETAHLLLVMLNVSIACCLNSRTALEYLGQVNMLALTTTLLALPVAMLNKYGLINDRFFNHVFLVLLTCFVFKEYKRRMNFSGIITKYPIVYFLNIICISGFVIFLLLNCTK